MNHILILKKLDAVIGRMATTLLPGSAKGGIGLCHKVLVIRPGGIGDAVLLIPVLQKLKEKYPKVSIDVLAERRNAAIFGMCSVVDRVLCYDRGGMLSALRSRYDVIIDTEQWHRLTAIVSRLTRAQSRIGFCSNERRKLFNYVVDYRHDTYELDSFFALLKPLGIDHTKEFATPFLTIPESERSSIQSLLKGFDARPFIALFPGASIPERRWGTEKFHQLAININDDGYPVVVIGGPGDRKAAEEIVGGCEGLNLAGETSLVGSAAIIERSALLISGDSGMLHIGVGLGRPTVSLFGSGIVAKWAPRGAGHVVLNKGLPCSPCTRFGTTPSCLFDVKCLADITVDEVHSAVKRLAALLVNGEELL